MDFLANRDFARGIDPDKALIAALKADFATLAASVQSGREQTRLGATLRRCLSWIGCRPGPAHSPHVQVFLWMKLADAYYSNCLCFIGFFGTSGFEYSAHVIRIGSLPRTGAFYRFWRGVGWVFSISTNSTVMALNRGARVEPSPHRLRRPRTGPVGRPAP